MSDTILAIDLGKFNSVLCWYEPATRATAFRTAKTTPADLDREPTRREGKRCQDPFSVRGSAGGRERDNGLAVVRPVPRVRPAEAGDSIEL